MESKDTLRFAVELLEKKREEFGESQRAFVKRIPWLSKTHRSRAAYYSQIKNGQRPFPSGKLPLLAEFLDCSLQDIKDFISKRECEESEAVKYLANSKITVKELECLTYIARKYGGELTFAAFSKHLEALRA